VEDTPSGRLLEGIIEVIDEFYSANLSQDVLRGMRENAGRGFCNGGRAPYGYIRVKVQDGATSRTKLEPDPKTAPIVQRIFRECLVGKGLKAIARGLNADGLASSTGKKCGAAMVGHRGGYRYQYYMCGSARRKGREVCPSPILRKDKVEGFVINRIKDCILTEENLGELVRLTNEELTQTCAEEREKLELLQVQIAEADSRLGKLYDALETGEFKGGELAPRIQALFQKKEELQQAKADAEEALRYQVVDMADSQVVREYVDDLRGLLERSSIIEQRGFLKSFVDKIEVGDSEVNMYYTIPMPPSSLPQETVGVIPFVHHG